MAKTKALEPLEIVGEDGGRFNIRSSGLGDRGILTVGGELVRVTRWDNNNIRGWLPEGAEGAIAINGVERGVYPTPPPAAPTVTSLAPTEAVLGAPSFDIHVMGTGFVAGSLIVFAGQYEPTTFVSDTEVTTGINMDFWHGPDALPVKVVNPDGQESNAMTFIFTAAATRTKK